MRTQRLHRQRGWRSSPCPHDPPETTEWSVVGTTPARCALGNWPDCSPRHFAHLDTPPWHRYLRSPFDFISGQGTRASM